MARLNKPGSDCSSTLVNTIAEELDELEKRRTQLSRIHLPPTTDRLREFRKKDQKLLETLINSPNKNFVRRNRTLPPKMSSHHQPEDDTFDFQPDDGTRRMEAIFDKHLNNTINLVEQSTTILPQNHTQTQTQPQTEIKSSRPTTTLNNRFRGAYKSADQIQTRQNDNYQVNDNNIKKPASFNTKSGLSTTHTQKMSQLPSSSGPSTTRFNQINSTNTKPTADTTNNNRMGAKNGWPRHPLIIQSKKKPVDSDTEEEEEDIIKPSPLDLPSSSLHRQKIFTAGEPSQKKVTFDSRKTDYSSSSLIHHKKGSPSTVSDSTNEESGSEEEQVTLNNNNNPPANQTLATPQILGQYPSTPAASSIPPTRPMMTTNNNSTSFMANEISKRRLEKLTNQYPSSILFNKKGKAKEIALPGPEVNEDQTIYNHNDVTKASCFPTPHPPGWLFNTTPTTTPGITTTVEDPSSSTCRRPIIRHPLTSALKKQRKNPGMGTGTGKNPIIQPSSSRLVTKEDINDKVIFASQGHSNNQNEQEDDNDNPTPRPHKRPNYQPSTNNPDFSSPSFEGFNKDRLLQLTSTPAHPSLHTLPRKLSPSADATAGNGNGNGPQRILKDLAASVIEFIVDKNPIETLLDSFSNRNLLKSKTSSTKSSTSLHKENDELDHLLKSSEKIHGDRLKIQDQLESLKRSSSNRPSQILSFFKKFSYSSSSSRGKKDYQHSGAGFWVGMGVQLFLIWMIINLSIIRTHNKLNSSVLGGPNQVPVNVYYMNRDRLSDYVDFVGHSSSTQNSTGFVYPRNREGLGDGVVEIGKFVIDWISGFSYFFGDLNRHGTLPPSYNHPRKAYFNNPILKWISDIVTILFRSYFSRTSSSPGSTSSKDCQRLVNRSYFSRYLLFDLHHQVPFVPT
ncbi:hypothetical protein MJO29_000537 [Puccinia striiformis f. sp. tritici]|nr:hypothetical protein MJO29_000537 [Puccinia striiformis f. sp. tritici]KAI9602063.1 hypothetical protein KEM48_001011 [Puccinia striiformis f. sp. tritici PST-130]